MLELRCQTGPHLVSQDPSFSQSTLQVRMQQHNRRQMHSVWILASNLRSASQSRHRCCSPACRSGAGGCVSPGSCRASAARCRQPSWARTQPQTQVLFPQEQEEKQHPHSAQNQRGGGVCRAVEVLLQNTEHQWRNACPSQ